MKTLIINELNKLGQKFLIERDKIKNSEEYRKDIIIAELKESKIGHEENIDIIKSWPEYSNIEAKFIMSKVRGDEKIPFEKYSYPAFCKQENFKNKYNQIIKLNNMINKLELKPCPEELKLYLNEYGLFIDRMNIYFTDDFNKLNDRDKVLVFIQELIQSYAEKAYECEGLLGLSHIGLIDEFVPYAQTKRSKLIKEFEETYGYLPIIVKTSRQKTKYMKNLVKTKAELIENQEYQNIYYIYERFSSTPKPYFKLITAYAGF